MFFLSKYYFAALEMFQHIKQSIKDQIESVEAAQQLRFAFSFWRANFMFCALPLFSTRDRALLSDLIKLTPKTNVNMKF